MMEPGIAIPILPARDLEETRKFYERLGFNATGWWPKEFGGSAIGTPRLTDIADRLWGMREFSIVDPNGNLVRIGHEIATKR